MAFNEQTLNQLNLLSCFDDHSLQSGIKVHSSAESAQVEAAKQLYEKGLITQVDGGYLTDLGVEALEHLQHLRGILGAG